MISTFMLCLAVYSGSNVMSLTCVPVTTDKKAYTALLVSMVDRDTDVIWSTDGRVQVEVSR